MKKAFQDMLHGLGEVNPVHAYYNGSCTSKDNEDPSWSTSFKTRRTQKTSSALEDFISVVFVPDRNIISISKNWSKLIISKTNSTKKFLYKITQQLEIARHVLCASRVNNE
ncbi:hypothetical protein Tco_1439229 [Tanacetum coccineum]